MSVPQSRLMRFRMELRYLKPTEVDGFIDKICEVVAKHYSPDHSDYVRRTLKDTNFTFITNGNPLSLNVEFRENPPNDLEQIAEYAALYQNVKEHVEISPKAGKIIGIHDKPHHAVDPISKKIAMSAAGAYLQLSPLTGLPVELIVLYSKQ